MGPKKSMQMARMAIGFDAFKAGGGEVVPAGDALVKAVAERTGKFEAEWIKMVDGKGMDGKAILAEYRAEVKKLTESMKK